MCRVAHEHRSSRFALKIYPFFSCSASLAVALNALPESRKRARESGSAFVDSHCEISPVFIVLVGPLHAASSAQAQRWPIIVYDIWWQVHLRHASHMCRCPMCWKAPIGPPRPIEIAPAAKVPRRCFTDPHSGIDAEAQLRVLSSSLHRAALGHLDVCSRGSLPSSRPRHVPFAGGRQNRSRHRLAVLREQLRSVDGAVLHPMRSAAITARFADTTWIGSASRKWTTSVSLEITDLQSMCMVASACHEPQ